MSLFQQTIINEYAKSLDNNQIAEKYQAYKAYFLNPEVQENIIRSKEEQFQEGFLRELFVNMLGYTLNPDPNYNLITEQKNEGNAQKADGAILVDEKVIGVIELKDHKTSDLSKVEQQAFGYKSRNKNAVYVIISNFEKLRFYIDDAVDCEEFDLFELSEKQFRNLWICLSFESIRQNIPKELKNKSVSRENDVTLQLYKDYSKFKRILFDNICSYEENLRLADKLTLFKKSQKLLDRLLFILFAEDRGLLTPNTIRKIIAQWEELRELDAYVPFYARLKQYFEYLNTGHKGKDFEVFAYNGGLFKADEVLNALKIDDEVLVENSNILAEYDFASEVDVNILGHIFENSLSEIEEISNSITSGNSGTPQNIGKRKKDGVFYTPQYITKYIVENTVGKICSGMKEEIGIHEEDYFSDSKRSDSEKRKLIDRLDEYRSRLLKLTICDPACGSGAFLNAALSFLIDEHKLIDEMNAKVLGGGFVFREVENSILENNLFGVDINEESVEIARLSLWLRTAKPHRKLSTLSNNIKCGNSLIDDPEVAGEKAFDWKKEFPQVFANGGFDVVIGNPPYVQLQSMGKMSDVYASCGYESYNKSADLYCLFYERGVTLLKNKGLLGFIASNKWLKVNYGLNLRKYLITNTNPFILVDFPGVKIFTDATVDPEILILKKESYFKKTIACTFKGLSHDIQYYFDKHSSVFTFSEEAWIIQSKGETDILKKMQNGKALKDLPLSIYRGILTGYNDAFFIDEETKNRLIAEDSKSAELIKPLMRGRDITAWCSNNDSLYLINTHNGNKEQGIEPINIEYYPAIKKHLDQYYTKLEVRGDKGQTPYNLRNCAYLEEFDKPKIIYPNMTSVYPFCFDENHSTGNDKTFIITAKDNSISLRFLTAVFNSKLVKLWIRYNCPELGEKGREIRKAYFENLCIPQIPLESQQPFIVLADKMLDLNKQLQKQLTNFIRLIKNNLHIEKLSTALQNFYTLDFAGFLKEVSKQKTTDGTKAKIALKDQAEWNEAFDSGKSACATLQGQIAETDAEINRLVYELYGLTDDEIKIVEA